MKGLQECLFYEKKAKGKVRCILCPQYCLIEDGQVGFCNVRKNESGILYSMNYGVISSYAMDPIEKKPLSRFHPGSKILSIGSFGCNLKCSFCQNHGISQENREGIRTTPQNIADIASHEKGNIGIAYTYNEPSVWYEFVYETAKLNKENGKENILVTNGYINEKPLEKLLPYIDAMNIDLKGIDDIFYEEVCKGRVGPVLKTIRKSIPKCHVEITTLLVTKKVDNLKTVRSIAEWIGSIDRSVPFHLSRYFPNYQYSEQPTDIEFMKAAKREADKYLDYVYLGNI